MQGHFTWKPDLSDWAVRRHDECRGLETLGGQWRDRPLAVFKPITRAESDDSAGLDGRRGMFAQEDPSIIPVREDLPTLHPESWARRRTSFGLSRTHSFLSAVT